MRCHLLEEPHPSKILDFCLFHLFSLLIRHNYLYSVFFILKYY